MPTIKPGDISVAQFHQVLLGTIGPRPIAFASTVDASGRVNLSPFSFFNVFSANPPILIFSPARRVRDNTTKHTLENVIEVPEVTISIVNYEMVQQMSLASTEYDKGVDEFVKSGLTPVQSTVVKPPYVKESPASYECKVLEVKPLGPEGGAGNLVICEVVLAHIADSIYTADKIDPFKLDAVARMGGNWYARAQGSALFEVAKPLSSQGIGFDGLPVSIRKSSVLTGNHLGMLANVAALPTEEEVQAFSKEPEVSAILEALDHDHDALQKELHLLAIAYLEYGDVAGAWKVLLQAY